MIMRNPNKTEEVFRRLQTAATGIYHENQYVGGKRARIGDFDVVLRDENRGGSSTDDSSSIDDDQDCGMIEVASPDIGSI
jgi:hypothetical protein